MWKVEKLEVLLPYCRIRVLNSSGVNNDSFHLLVYAEPYFLIPEVPEVAAEVKTKKGMFSRYKSPGQRRVSIKPDTELFNPPFPGGSPGKGGLVDYRLPGFIPKGALLVGDKNGKVSVLPKGASGEYLMIDSDGFPSWMLPYPPVNK